METIRLRELFGDIREGDKLAFSAMYHELKKPVYTVVYRIVRTHPAAEDVTQELFLKLFTNPPDASVENPVAWVFKVARNLAIDTLRKNQPESLDEQLPTDGTETLSAEDRVDVETALNRLDGEQRQIVTLHLNADLTFREIAEITGLSAPAVFRRYNAAISDLRHIMNGGKKE